MKDIFKLKNLSLRMAALLLCLTCISCSNLFERDLQNHENNSSDGNTYLSISFSTKNPARTVKPTPITNQDLTDYTLKGKMTGSDEEQILAGPAPLSSFPSRISIDAGSWNLTLSAKYSGITFSASDSFEILPGANNTISFVLRPTESVGGYQIVFDLNDTQIKYVKAVLKSAEADSLFEPISETIDQDHFTAENTVVLKRDIADEEQRLQAGLYLLSVDFFADENDPTPINNWENYLAIKEGYVTEATFALAYNDIYEITYEDLDSGDAELISGLLIHKYSVRSSFTLPYIKNNSDKISVEWQDGSNKISKIKTGTTGNKNLTPHYLDTLYVSDSGTSDGNGAIDNPFKTIDAACTYISTNGTSDSEWAICIQTSTERSEIPSTITSEKAKSILLIGANGLDENGIPQDKICKINSTEKVSALKINTIVPVTISNLMITDGGGNTVTKGAGINIAQGATVCLGDGVVITKNMCGSNSQGGGVYNEGTLYMYGTAIVGDKTNGGKTDENAYGYGLDSSTDAVGPLRANWAVSGGAIFNGNASDSSIQAKLYLGYKPDSTGTPVKEELTGGLYYNGGTKGGALSNAGGSTVYYDSGIIAWNGTTDSGAGIYNNGGGRIEMTGGQIIHNKASSSSSTHGGGVFNASKTSVFIMSGGIINHNLVYRDYAYGDDSYGGGVYNNGKFFMYGTAVIGDKSARTLASGDPDHVTNTHTNNWGNKAWRGGAIYNNVNTASEQVGGVYIGYKPDSNGNPEVAEFTGGIFYNYSSYTSDSSSSQYGGGAIESSGTLKIAGGTIAYNKTEGYGGAIRTSSSSSYPFEISGGTIINNSAEKNGGAIFIASSNYSCLSLSGEISIPAGTDNKNDIYLTASSSNYYPKITITGSLGNDFAALITPGYYDSSMAILVNNNDGVETFADECAKFSVTPQIIDGQTVNWAFNSQGTLTTTPVTPTLSVEFNLNPTDINVSVTVDGSPVTSGTLFTGNSIVFTADPGYSSYIWTVEDEVQEATGNSLTLNTSSWSKGSYEVLLEATDAEGNHYSFWAQIKKN